MWLNDEQMEELKRQVENVCDMLQDAYDVSYGLEKSLENVDGELVAKQKIEHANQLIMIAIDECLNDIL